MKKQPQFIEKEWGKNGEKILVENPVFEFDENNPNQKKWRKNSNFTKKKKR